MDSKGNKIGLSLSGGGYRAAAYHIGTLRALHNMGILDKVDVISSVSGGSIASVYYLLHKDDFRLFVKTFSERLKWGVMKLACLNVFLFVAFFVGLGYFTSPWLSLLMIPVFWYFCYWCMPLNVWVEFGYRNLFFKNKTLSDLPDKPEVVINTTDVAQGNLFKFSKDRAWGYNYRDYHANRDYFTGVDFPLAKAVMASSCVPFAFTPVRMPKKYCKQKSSKRPLLVDGGLYDNQGVHELRENGKYGVKYVIVSNAGNTELSDDSIWNVVKMLIRTSEILMKRIERFQSRQNMFSTTNVEKRYAYINLNYDNTDRLVKSFVYNVASGLVPSEVYLKNGITEQEAETLRQDYKVAHGVQSEIHDFLTEKVKKTIGWDTISHLRPSGKEAKHARKVGTNLVGLSKYSRYCLAKYAEWMTYVQVRLYLPNLCE